MTAGGKPPQFPDRIPDGVRQVARRAESLRAKLGHRCNRVLRFAGPRRLVAYFRTGTCFREDHADHSVDGHLPAIPDVVYPGHTACPRREHTGRHHVAHVHEIPCLLAVTLDRDRLPCQRLPDEVRHHGIRARGVLPRAEHVEKSQGNDLGLARLREQRPVGLAVELRDRVGAARLGQHRFELRDRRVQAVHRRRAGEAYFLRARRRGFLQDVQIAGDVVGHALLEPFHPIRRVEHRREVEHPVHSLHRRADRLAIDDRAFDHLRVEPGEVGAVTGAQVVEDANVRLALKMFDEMAADEAAAAGHEDSHARRFAG